MRQLQEFKDKIELLRAEKARLNNELAAKAAARDALKAQLAHSKKLLHSVSQSRSWRITAPFRRILRMFAVSKGND